METTVILVVACLLAGAGIGAWLVSLRPRTTSQTPQPNTSPTPANPVAPQLTTTADELLENRVAMEDPPPPKNEGTSVGSRLYIQRDAQSGRIVLVQRTEWGAPTPPITAEATANVAVVGQDAEDARFARIREELEELRRERVAASAQPSPAPASPDPATGAAAPPPVLTIVPAGTAPATP